MHYEIVIPAKAGIQNVICIDSYFHGNDEHCIA